MKADTVTLVCPQCKRTRKTPKHSSDPAGTVRIVVLCPKCNYAGWDDASYFNAVGQQIFIP